MTMQFELKSAFSAKASWDSIAGAESYTIQWKAQDAEVKQATSTTPAIVLVNRDPDTSYEVCVLSSDSTVLVSGSVQTWPLDDPHLDNLYSSIKLEDGTYDATQFDKPVHDIFLKYFNDIVQDGDTIYTSVILKGAPKNVETRAVVEGSTADVSGDQNLFLPFTKDSEASQVVTLNDAVPIDDTLTTSDEASSVELVYSPNSDSFSIGGMVLGIGDKFNLFGKMVTVADGSIVLVFEDTVARVYPFETSTASNVVGSLGSQFAKNITCNVINVVGSKTTGVSGTTSASGWIYDTETDTIAEATRIVHTIDENSESGTLSFGVLHTDAKANAFIEPVIECASGSTIISAQDASDKTVSTTIDSTGISFDTDDASFISDQRKSSA